ncbi:hypothetical protein SISNIDRAFT_475764 [Sistotremastrum niveocremeum HHB9708]|nr:hypothetical protein SISNIDRAFT_475764 [Sistotremastrum niveocremeum HHB9708]
MFECSICMDEHLVDDVALVEKCGHKFCRECMTDYIGSKLTENRFPILCPVCQAESDVQDAGFIQRGLVDQLALSQAQYDSWIDLELSQYSVMLDCRKCQSSGFVDSEDYKELQYIYCPLGDCDHVWCKACGQTVGPDQESQKLHSCDGENELNALMEAEGWKNCPGCKTPIERIIGCNHMACGTPGCNMHFCYKCGDSIIRSVLKDEIKGAVNAHFHQTTGKCPLFFIPAEDEGTS